MHFLSFIYLPNMHCMIIESPKVSENNSGLNLGTDNEVIQVINRLRSVGAQMEIDLPTIALCGQQSSGKSSLTEAICGIAMPRNGGTCTRCPTEIRMIQRDGPFKCIIGIRYEYDDNNQCPLKTVTEKQISIVTDPQKVTNIVAQVQGILH